MSFKTYTLGEIASNTSRRFNFNNREQVCFVNTGDILDGHFLVDEKVSSIGLPGQAKKAIQKGDILYSEIRPGNKRHLLVKTDVDDYVVSTKFMVITCNQDIVIPEYLYLVLTSKECEAEFKVIADSRSGTFPQITFDAVAYYPIELPSLAQQRAVVEFIKSITGKINLSKLTNQTLEQMAQAIFKSWFVDFDPVKAKMNGEQPEGMDAATASLFPEKLVESALGLIPEGWAVNQLSDICKNHSQSYDLKSVDEVVFVNTGDVLEGDFLHKDYSSVEGLPGQAKKAIKEDDILYSEIRPKNKRYAYVDFDVSDYVVSTKFMVIQANEKVHPRLLYMMLTRQNTIDEFNVIADSRSGTFPQITFKAISNLEFCMAPREVQDAFVAQVMPMIKLQRSLKTENKQLADLRDTLLPKLLSGEIELGATEALELEA
ncbi:restriction endonuclease subunit S [Vibrio parahaemolyticus]|nr:restriction endonuclease subunit S [Vibrio parahaemolyticus]EJG2002648.1 restriction endonuclease subunit S [Vibrio parahaemolyticus]EJG2036908.1 restriction endonuclease subunit S [Vibrio parahaemolyticus]EJG2043750.1 restriction endonuclease subunit S [Vibrio parahaemolyticus]EJG2232159.1 restriction endonuclease subunit S [Vibrio parahaemolyticus]